MKKIINPFINLEGYNCFGCAPNNPFGVKMEFYEDGEDIVCHWTPRSEYQGWLDTLHGGIQSVLLDEICAWVLMRKLQTAGVTSKMETRFLKPVSTNDSQITLRAHITEQKRNIIIIDATLENSVGEICSQSRCTYFAFPQEKAKQEMFFSGCLTEGE
jgi:uncharacterized protein (TIGR00369 family)